AVRLDRSGQLPRAPPFPTAATLPCADALSSSPSLRIPPTSSDLLLAKGLIEIVEGLGEELDPLFEKGVGDVFEVDADGGEVFHRFVRLVETFRERHRRVAMILVIVERGPGHRVDSFRPEEVFDIVGVGILWILGAGRSPEDALHARSFGALRSELGPVE